MSTRLVRASTLEIFRVRCLLFLKDCSCRSNCCWCLIEKRLGNKFFNELGIPPNTSDLDIATDHNTLAVFNVIEEFTDVNSAIGINLLAVLIADSVFEDTDDLGVLSYIIIAAETGHLRVMELSWVLITVAEVRNSFTFEETKAEFTLENTVWVVE